MGANVYNVNLLLSDTLDVSNVVMCVCSKSYDRMLLYVVFNLNYNVARSLVHTDKQDNYCIHVHGRMHLL